MIVSTDTGVELAKAWLHKTHRHPSEGIYLLLARNNPPPPELDAALACSWCLCGYYMLEKDGFLFVSETDPVPALRESLDAYLRTEVRLFRFVLRYVPASPEPHVPERTYATMNGQTGTMSFREFPSADVAQWAVYRGGRARHAVLFQEQPLPFLL